jgi:hypothetical protein
MAFTFHDKHELFCDMSTESRNSLFGRESRCEEIGPNQGLASGRKGPLTAEETDPRR